MASISNQVKVTSTRLKKVGVLKIWKFFIKKLKEFRLDKITAQFVEHDKSVFLQDVSPANPGIVVDESSDSLKFFNINAVTSKMCARTGPYRELTKNGEVRDEGSFVRWCHTTEVNYEGYNPCISDSD